jgi:hypothetical protein
MQIYQALDDIFFVNSFGSFPDEVVIKVDALLQIRGEFSVLHISPVELHR